MNITIYKKLYTWVIFLVPTLYQYSILGGMIDLDVIAMLLVFLLSFTHGVASKKTFIKDYLLIAVYTIIITVMNLILGRLYSSAIMIVLRTGRYLLYLYIALVRNLDLFDYKYAMNVYRKIALCASLYLYLQAAFYYGAGITLPNKIGGAVFQRGAWTEIGRLRSFFSEPAAFGYAMIPFIVCSLFGQNYKGRDSRLLDAVFVSAAVAISTSGQGTICVAAVWVVWIIRQMLNGGISVNVFVSIVLVVAGAYILTQTSIMKFSIGRMTYTGRYGAVSARASGYQTLTLLRPINLIFGTGYGNYVIENVYGLDVPYQYVNYSSLAEYLFTTGVIGTIIIVSVLGRRLIGSQPYVRALLFATLILSLSGCPLAGTYIPLYFSLIFCIFDNPLNEKQASVKTSKYIIYK